MESEKKIVVVAKEGVALVGNAFHTLIGMAVLIFKTSIIDQFRAYLEKYAGSPGIIAYDEDLIVAFPATVDYNSSPVAECEIKTSPYLEKLSKIVGQRLTLDKMEDALNSLREFFDASGKSLLDFCSNAQINKIVKMVKSKDNSGNLTLSLSRESGADDYKCPKKIKFTLPVIAYIDKMAEFEFDVILNSSDRMDTPQIDLCFQNLNFNLQVEEEKRAIITDEIQALPWPKYYGSLELEKSTDEWKYKANEVK